MKKLTTLLSATALTILLTGCGTSEVSDGKYYFTDVSTGDGTECLMSDRAFKEDMWVVDVTSSIVDGNKAYFFDLNPEFKVTGTTETPAYLVENTISTTYNTFYGSLSTRIYDIKLDLEIEINDDVDRSIWLKQLDVTKSGGGRKGSKTKDFIKKVLDSAKRANPSLADLDKICLVQKPT